MTESGDTTITRRVSAFGNPSKPGLEARLWTGTSVQDRPGEGRPSCRSFTPAVESHGLWPWMNEPTFGRDVAPNGRWSGAAGFTRGAPRTRQGKRNTSGLEWME